MPNLKNDRASSRCYWNNKQGRHYLYRKHHTMLMDFYETQSGNNKTFNRHSKSDEESAAYDVQRLTVKIS